MRRVLICLGRWLYRCWLVGATGGLSLLLLRLQAVLSPSQATLSPWQHALQWAELSWLIPVPMALFLWLGWFMFAEAVRPDPSAVPVPRVVVRDGRAQTLASQPVTLVFRFVTRGEHVEVLRQSVLAAHQALARYPHSPAPYRVEVISECPVALGHAETRHIGVYVVPPDYSTPHRSRFKARALTYMQEISRPAETDWYIYLDEESMIDVKLVAGIYRFIAATLNKDRRSQQTGAQRPARVIGQGTILYQGGHWFFRGADALRTADDIGRFRLQYALGVPMFGIHGSFIVIQGLNDAQLSFDVGASNSMTEDAAWALRAWAKGFRFAWIAGYLHEQPPQRVGDFIKQRSRWISGVRLVACDSTVPLRYRLVLGLFALLWQVALIPLLVAFAVVFAHVSPFLWMRLPADVAWATFMLAYLQGAYIQAAHPHVVAKGRSQWSWITALASLPLVLCALWYAVLEMAGVGYSLRPRQGFFVVHKPSLRSPIQEYPFPKTHSLPQLQPLEQQRSR